MEKNKTICSKCGDEYDTYRDGECQTCEVEEEYEILGKPCTEPEPVDWEEEFAQNFCAMLERSQYNDEQIEEVYSFISTQIAKAEKDTWSAQQMLWDRMEEWQDEWAKEKPQERKLVMADALKLIEWKIAKTHQEEETKWRKLLNSGKQMYELGKKEERERINCAVEKLRIPDDWNKGKDTETRIADIVGTNLSATERYNSVLNEISILINKLT